MPLSLNLDEISNIRVEGGRILHPLRGYPVASIQKIVNRSKPGFLNFSCGSSAGMLLKQNPDFTWRTWEGRFITFVLKPCMNYELNYVATNFSEFNAQYYLLYIQNLSHSQFLSII